VGDFFAMLPIYCLAIGGAMTLRDLDVALACGQRHFLASVATPTVRHLRTIPDATVVLDSGAWPINNPQRPSLDAWWQELRRYRCGPGDYGNLAYALAYDHVGDPARSEEDSNTVMGKVFEREAAGDAPIVPVLQFPTSPQAIALDLECGWAGTRPDWVAGAGDFARPVYALGGLVPQRGNVEAVQWVKDVAEILTDLIDEGWNAEALGIHVLGSTRQVYLDPLLEAGVPVWCDTSTPGRNAGFGIAAFGQNRYSDRYNIPWPLIKQSRFARLAYWLCRERDNLGLPWCSPDLAWLAELPTLSPITQPAEQLALLDAV
jgi:hypothetical protein